MTDYKSPSEDFKIKSIYDIFEMVRERPAMYTGSFSLQSLRNFCNGFEFGVNNCGYELSRADKFDGFHDFVASELNFSASTAGWANMILAYAVFSRSSNIEWEKLDKLATEDNHKESQTLFYSLLEKYRVRS